MKTFLALFLLIIVSCQNKPKVHPAVKLDLKHVVKEIMISAKNCALITVDSLGIAHSRPMDPFAPNTDFIVWMATNPLSKKVSQIKQNNNVTLYYFDPINIASVSIQGTAQLVNDKIAKDSLWKNEWKNFYKNRTTDYVLIKFTPKQLNLISEQHNIFGDTLTWESPQISF